MTNDTIYALATPQGRGAIAVIRVSGPDALAGYEALTNLGEPQKGHMRYVVLRHPVSRETLDQAMAVFFKEPRSFTGEDTVEYSLHGSPAVIDACLDALSQCQNHRPAEPGEFTKRAFVNGKLDLTEAEAVNDLVNAQTHLQREQALSQLSGNLSALYNAWAKELTAILAHLEADIEFPDEDLPDDLLHTVVPKIAPLKAQIEAHLDDNNRGEMMREGLHVAIIGAPNAGKSSLINALASRDVAIVSDLAGTTRDILEVNLDLAGYPIILSDTAGLKPAEIAASGHDAIEQEGIRRARERAKNAAIRLLLYDGRQEPDADLSELAGPRSLFVATKKDLPEARISDKGHILISSETGEGLPALIDAVTDMAKDIMAQESGPPLTRQRHRIALQDVNRALARVCATELPELAAEDLRLAVRSLGRITGRVDIEDILDVVFRDFCIGK